MVQFRAQPALPIDGKASWYGQYRLDDMCPWRTAASDYGMIRYTSEAYALAGAKAYMEQREARENAQ